MFLGPSVNVKEATGIPWLNKGMTVREIIERFEEEARKEEAEE